MSSQLEEILSQKKHNLDENAKEWEPLEKKQYVRVDFSEIVITEQLLGTYKAPCMTICFMRLKRIMASAKWLISREKALMAHCLISSLETEQDNGSL
ncbi:MAG: hypothetical protein LC660_04990 [Desulfobacteraceae bacterium]|nr:hypothetical protein [Desulfobacteraceae bacterium]